MRRTRSLEVQRAELFGRMVVGVRQLPSCREEPSPLHIKSGRLIINVIEVEIMIYSHLKLCITYTIENSLARIFYNKTLLYFSEQISILR